MVRWGRIGCNASVRIVTLAVAFSVPVRLILFIVILALALRGWEELSDIGPWRPVSLHEDVRPFAVRKIDALHEDDALCQSVLVDGGVRFTLLDPLRDATGQCGYDNALLLSDDDVVPVRPAARVSCPMAVALALWHRKVVDPAAMRHLGSPVARIESLGTYNCRRIGNGPTGNFSEHATADAIDVAGFRLANGTRISVRQDWSADDANAAFLRDVRDGACRIFATTLSPDYNSAHADHFHFDTARRGGFAYCR